MLSYYLQTEEIIWAGGPQKKERLFQNWIEFLSSFFMYGVVIIISIVVLLGSIAATYHFIETYDELISQQKRTGIVTLLFSWIFVISAIAAPNFYFYSKWFITRKHFEGLKYTLTNKAAYISIDREVNNLARMPYSEMRKISRSFDKKKGIGSIIFTMPEPVFVNNKLWSFDFENTVNPEFSQLENVDQVFDIIKSITRYDVQSTKPRQYYPGVN